MIRDDTIREYADLLQANGFAIYEPADPATYFMYSRMVDGKECFGLLQREYFGTLNHSMPIRPHVNHGSAIAVTDVPDGPAALTVEVARKVARPANRGKWFDNRKFENYRDDRFMHLYTRR